GDLLVPGLHRGLRDDAGRPAQLDALLQPLPLLQGVRRLRDGLCLGDGVDPLRAHARRDGRAVQARQPGGPLRGRRMRTLLPSRLLRLLGSLVRGSAVACDSAAPDAPDDPTEDPDDDPSDDPDDNPTDEPEPLELIAAPAPEWSALFDRTSGWTGADGIFSVPLEGRDAPGGASGT